MTFEITARVVIDTDEPLNRIDSEVAKIAADKIKSKSDEYIHNDNVTNVECDLDCPFDPDCDKVELRIPSSKEMIELAEKMSIYDEFPENNIIWLPYSVWVDKDTYINAVWILGRSRFMAEYEHPDSKNVGLPLVDWSDIPIGVKLKIMKAMEYEN